MAQNSDRPGSGSVQGRVAAQEPPAEVAGGIVRPRGADPRTVGGSASTGAPDRDSMASVPELVRRLSSEGADLVRQEVALAKAEMAQKVDVIQKNLVSIGVGAGLLLAALLYALWAVNTGLTAGLTEVVDPTIAIWLAPLILAVVLGAIGGSMVSRGKDAIAEEGLVPEQSRESLNADRRWAQDTAHQVKEEVTG